MEISGLPYWEIEFDKRGRVDVSEVTALRHGIADAGITDLFVFSHGWNNDPGLARKVFRRFFDEVDKLRRDQRFKELEGARLGILGVLWPARYWADERVPLE